MKRVKDHVEGRGMLPTEALEEGKGVAQWQSPGFITQHREQKAKGRSLLCGKINALFTRIALAYPASSQVLCLATLSSLNNWI